MPVAASGSRVPERLADRYVLAGPLGSGGMGTVYRARDELLDREVAVKLVVDDGSLGQDFGQMCVREARAAASVRHPGIVQVYDGGVDQGIGFVVMECVDGPTLRDALAERGALPPDEAVEIAAHLADALAAAHAAGVVHCDVKPRNVLLPPGASPILVDFGIARTPAHTGTLDVGGPRGSVHYVAPEQLDGGVVDGRSDVYALGAMTYEMLTGRLPFEGTNPSAVATMRLVGDPKPMRDVNAPVPPSLEGVVLTALARDPTRRYTADAFRDALRAAVAGDATVPLDTLPAGDATVRLVGLPPRTDPSRVQPPLPSGRFEWEETAGTRRRAPGRWLWVLLGLLALLAVVFLVMQTGLASRGGSAVAVPNLVGKRLGDAPTALRRAGLVAGAVETRAADPPAVGTILEQKPPPDAPAHTGDAVSIVVAVAR